MKTNILTIGVLVAALASATSFAADAVTGTDGSAMAPATTATTPSTTPADENASTDATAAAPAVAPAAPAVAPADMQATTAPAADTSK